MATDFLRTAVQRGPATQDTASGPPTPSRAWPAFVAVAVGVVAGGYLPQVVTPFIRRDDWPYLLPTRVPGSFDIYARNLAEGRWLNYLWWLVVGQHESPSVASVVYALAYAFFVVGFTRLFDLRGRLATGLLALAVFASPLWERLVYWPATLTPSVIVAALAVWTLPRAAVARRGLVAWLVLVTVLCVLTYPPVAPILLVAALVRVRDRPWRTTLGAGVAFVAGYAVGILSIYALNWIAFRHFGIQIAAWRHPNAAHNLHDLAVNARRYLSDVRSLARALGWGALGAGTVVGIGALVDRTTRAAWLRILTGLVLVVALDGAQTLLTGVATNPRGLLWGWLFAVVPAGLLVSGVRWGRWVGTITLVALAVSGLLQWRSDVAAHQQTRREYAAIVDAVVARQQAERHDVVLYQDHSLRGTLRGDTVAGTVEAMLYEYGGVASHWCSKVQCAHLPPARGGSVLPLGPAIVVVLPPPPSWL